MMPRLARIVWGTGTLTRTCTVPASPTTVAASLRHHLGAQDLPERRPRTIHLSVEGGPGDGHLERVRAFLEPRDEGGTTIRVTQTMRGLPKWSTVAAITAGLTIAAVGSAWSADAAVSQGDVARLLGIPTSCAPYTLARLGTWWSRSRHAWDVETIARSARD